MKDDVRYKGGHNLEDHLSTIQSIQQTLMEDAHARMDQDRMNSLLIGKDCIEKEIPYCDEKQVKAVNLCIRELDVLMGNS